MLELNLDQLSDQELIEKRDKLVDLIPQTSYGRRAQLQGILRAYIYEVNRRKELTKYSSESRS